MAIVTIKDLRTFVIKYYGEVFFIGKVKSFSGQGNIFDSIFGTDGMINANNCFADKYHNRIVTRGQIQRCLNNFFKAIGAPNACVVKGTGADFNESDSVVLGNKFKYGENVDAEHMSSLRRYKEKIDSYIQNNYSFSSSNMVPGTNNGEPGWYSLRVIGGGGGRESGARILCVYDSNSGRRVTCEKVPNSDGSDVWKNKEWSNSAGTYTSCFGLWVSPPAKGKDGGKTSAKISDGSSELQGINYWNPSAIGGSAGGVGSYIKLNWSTRYVQYYDEYGRPNGGYWGSPQKSYIESIATIYPGSQLWSSGSIEAKNSLDGLNGSGSRGPNSGAFKKTTYNLDRNNGVDTQVEYHNGSQATSGAMTSTPVLFYKQPYVTDIKLGLGGAGGKSGKADFIVQYKHRDWVYGYNDRSIAESNGDNGIDGGVQLKRLSR